MAAGLDCVAVTDHNSGAWIDPLKRAYTELAADAAAGNVPDFRELTLFPGVEISVQGGVHILAILAPSATTRDIDGLLARVDYPGTPGDSDDVTTKGIAAVIEVIVQAGAIPIPAHADQLKGLLACEVGSRKSRVDARTLAQAMDANGLLAVEWCDGASPLPECVAARGANLARVLGSDCHSFRGQGAPGRAFTWVKMAAPTLDGLRLALLDGNDVSLRRSDAATFDPDTLPTHTISAIEIDRARYIGHNPPARIELSPFFNAIVGGRGTGKSTVVHALRLATGRGSELTALGEGAESRRQFEAFRRIVKGREGDGGLRDQTVIRVEWRHDTENHRLTWSAAGSATVVEDWVGDTWVPARSQAVNASRFPLRMFSQGQIASIAGEDRSSLLAILDEAAGVVPLQAELEEAKRTFMAQRARLRELEGRLADVPEVERKLAEAQRRLEAFSQADHAAVLRMYARTQNQYRDIKATFEQAREAASRVEAVAVELSVDDWTDQAYGDDDADLLGWRAGVSASLLELQGRLRAEAESLRAKVEGWNIDERIVQWRARHGAARRTHDTLLEQLQAQGVQDAGAFQRLTQERQGLEQRKRELERARSDRDALASTIEGQRALIAERRASITAARHEFVERVLRDNPHVRISVEPHGFDPRQIARELRTLLETGESFASEILDVDDDDERGGLALTLARAGTAHKAGALSSVQRTLLERVGVGGKFRSFLDKKLERPEYGDRILAWSPDDDLKIEYQRGTQWVSIAQGSQGQRSAALLAFLLAFGEEPIVLDQPEDDLDNHLIYDLIVQQIRQNKLRRQLLIVTHNSNVVVNGDAELVTVMEFGKGQCFVQQRGALQETRVRAEVCRVMEGGQEAFARRWKRLGRGG